MGSVLWIRAEHEIRERLANTQGIDLVLTEDGLEIAAPAYRVWMSEDDGEILVWAGEHYHEHFRDPELAANCLCWFLTPFYRLVEDYRGEQLLQAFVERFYNGEWEAKAGGPLFLDPGTQVRANRRIVRQHAVTSPGPMKEIDPWLDTNGLPPNSHLGERELEVDHLVGLSAADLGVLELMEEGDPMFGDLLESLYAQEGVFDLVADETGFEVRPHAPDTFPVRVERAEGENRMIALGYVAVGEPMQVAGLAVLLLSGFARVVEEYAGDRRKSVAVQVYGPEGWTYNDRGPRYSSMVAKFLRTTETRYWQQRVETGLDIATQDDVDLDDAGWPRGSRWGCHRE